MHELFALSMGLAKAGKWPVGWSFQDLGTVNALGFIELAVCRERAWRSGQKTGWAFRREGQLVVASVTPENAELIVRSDNERLLAFADELARILAENLQRGGVRTDHRRRPLPPELGSRVRDWLDFYHAVKSGGFKITFPDLAELSGYSANTFKKAHAGYKRERGIDLPIDLPKSTVR